MFGVLASEIHDVRISSKDIRGMPQN